MLVQQILNSKPDAAVFSITPDQTVASAAEILSERRIGAIIVSSDGQKADGILSERDIVREIGKRGPTSLNLRVSDVMTPKPKSCTVDMTADRVLHIMSKGRFRHMPVVSGDKMIGVITQGDVVKLRLEELAMEKDALEGMIMGH